MENTNQHEHKCKRCGQRWRTPLVEPKKCRWCRSVLWDIDRKNPPGAGRPVGSGGGAGSAGGSGQITQTPRQESRRDPRGGLGKPGEASGGLREKAGVPVSTLPTPVLRVVERGPDFSRMTLEEEIRYEVDRVCNEDPTADSTAVRARVAPFVKERRRQRLEGQQDGEPERDNPDPKKMSLAELQARFGLKKGSEL